MLCHVDSCCSMLPHVFSCCPQVPMPTFETILPAVVHAETDAEVAANRFIATIVREEGPSHQHLAPSHLECLGATCLRAPSGVQLGMTQFCRCEFLQLWGPTFGPQLFGPGLHSPCMPQWFCMFPFLGPALSRRLYPRGGTLL